MAGPAETPFNALLHADSDHALPDFDVDVSAYGVIVTKGGSLTNIEARLDLPSGLRWLHTHTHDLRVTLALSAASED